jgi:hypothetical protein
VTSSIAGWNKGRIDTFDSIDSIMIHGSIVRKS